jgi:5-methylthioadenosine/S-adenosylhomocysteine deaminase
MDLLDEARLAILMQRVRTGRYDAVSATKALELATLGAARALGLGHEVGSLDVGKAADLAAFPLHHARSAPVYDPATALVAVAGRVLVRDSTLVTDVAPTSIADHARALADWSRSETAP